MMPRETKEERRFKDVLEPFGRMYWDFGRAVSDRLRAMSDDELNELERACHFPTETNIWYASLDQPMMLLLGKVHLAQKARSFLAEQEEPAKT